MEVLSRICCSMAMLSMLGWWGCSSAPSDPAPAPAGPEENQAQPAGEGEVPASPARTSTPSSPGPGGGNPDPVPVVPERILASGDNPPQEGKDRAFDGSSLSKWLVAASSGWIRYRFGRPIRIDGYLIASANDHPERDPKSWVLEGSADDRHWTLLDERTDESFSMRHQRKHYLLGAPPAPYQFYRLALQSRDGPMLQLSEIEFFDVEDPYRAIASPEVIYKDGDPQGGGKVFAAALPRLEDDVWVVGRTLCKLLYRQPGDLPFELKKINISVENTGGVAWKSGNPPEISIGFSAQYLKDIAGNGQSVRDEVLGVLYHEMVHGYQLAEGSDGGFYRQFSYVVEGMADALRYAVGYHDRYANPGGGSWTDSYRVTGRFFLWIEEKKHPGFLVENNHSLDGNDGVWWKASEIQRITGTDADALWSEYQRAP